MQPCPRVLEGIQADWTTCQLFKKRFPHWGHDWDGTPAPLLVLSKEQTKHVRKRMDIIESQGRQKQLIYSGWSVKLLPSEPDFNAIHAKKNNEMTSSAANNCLLCNKWGHDGKVRLHCLGRVTGVGNSLQFSRRNHAPNRTTCDQQLVTIRRPFLFCAPQIIPGKGARTSDVV